MSELGWDFNFEALSRDVTPMLAYIPWLVTSKSKSQANSEAWGPKLAPEWPTWYQKGGDFEAQTCMN